MLIVRKIINKLSKSQKITCLIVILSLIFLLSIGIPTLARFKNRNTILTVPVWDGSVATSYRKGNGTVGDPYIISNGSELAYFYTQLQNNDYDNNYFALSNDIVLNDGVFNYDEESGITYILNGETYYVDHYSNKYYDNVNREGNEIGSLNTFNSLNGFKGSFDGKSFTIYGLYITDENSDELALFTDLKGDIKNLYVQNSVVHGGTITAGIASIANDVSLKNILFDGYVVGRKTNLTKSINTKPSVSDISLSSVEKTDYIDLTNNIPFIGSEIVSTSITGNYVITGSDEESTSIKINGVEITNGSFEIDLGSVILDKIPVETSTNSDEATLTFLNLSYNIEYNYAVAGGIIAVSDNTTIENVINKAYVYGNNISGGIVGVTTSSLNINQSYNVGNIDSEYVSGGLISTIEKSNNVIVVSKSYNTGEINSLNNGGLIGVASNNRDSILLSNVFNTSNNYSIGTIEGTVINVTNAYFVNGPTAIKNGSTNGNFVLTSMENLKTSNFLIDNLSLNEFVSFADLDENNQNAWVFEYDSLPILFIDDLNNPIANINVNLYSWNNFSGELNKVRLNSKITFNIEAASELIPLKEIYYYISNSTEALTKDELNEVTSWNSYSGIVQITEEGFYVVYAKVIDYNDNVTYLNTDILVLDLSSSSASVSVDGKTWEDLREPTSYIYIGKPTQVTIEAVDNLSGVSSIKYYITDEILSEKDLEELSESNWITYNDDISISEVGTYIVYVKVLDNCDYVTYINTDYIVFDGYNYNDLIIGRNPSSYIEEQVYITDKSTITMNINYSNSSSKDLNNHTHNLISNILLPKGTKITLIDNVLEKIYEYKISTDVDIYGYNNSCNDKGPDCLNVATYPFVLFNEIGTGSTDKPFVENSYYDKGVTTEDFTIVLDLSNTNISTNYNDVMLYMELHDSDGISVRPTLYNTIKKFNIYSNINEEDTSADLYLTTDYNGTPIEFNSDSLTNINITSKINYKYINDHKIIDTLYEDKKIGLSIKLVDSDGNIVDRSHLKNFIFRIGDEEYYPDKDNTLHIDLTSGIEEVTKTLTIITSENNDVLAKGLYYFKISNYSSYDGYHYDELGSTELSIPVNVTGNNSRIEYDFDVIMDDTNRLINKTNDNVKVTFDILQNGSLNNPNIRVSLYKKNQLTAYNQDYSLVDLSSYVSDSLNLFDNKVYYVSTNPVKYEAPNYLYNHFELNLITDNFENNGYKFVFELYDNTKKIGTIEKHFVVR
ncbi:MAG TPA: hypothetical protein GXZ95_02580 [Mollicutes bacterium]|nr:hypothetical protein [Mollicutes bacterium]